MLKEVADEIDMGTQYHLTRFAFLYESTIVGDGTLLNPMGAPDEGESRLLIIEDARLLTSRTRPQGDLRRH